MGGHLASIGGTLSKVYDGTTTAAGATVSGTVTGGAAGDTFSLITTPVGLAYDYSNVLLATAVVASGTPTWLINNTAVGSLSSDYAFTAPVIANAPATITPLAAASWKASVTSGIWSDAANWDVLPTTANVLSAVIPVGSTVNFDGSGPSTALNSISSQGKVLVSGGNLSIASSLSTTDYEQTGGSTVTGAGSLTVSNSFVQSSGSIALSGPVSITQTTGNLTVGNISGGSIALSAANGAITQTAPLISTGLLSVNAANGGVTLTNSQNAVAKFSAQTTGTGDVALTNVGPLDVQSVTVANGSVALSNVGTLGVQGITVTGGNVAVTNVGTLNVQNIAVAGGNVVIDNTGAFSNSNNGSINASGAVSIVAHSPITINGAVNAGGDITLAALTPDLGSNITLDGAMTSTGGGISVQAYNNVIQNSRLTAALGIDVGTVAGTFKFGLNAFSVGNPVYYAANGVSFTPPWLSSSAVPNDLMGTFLENFQAALDEQIATSDDPLGLKKRDGEGLVVEGEICKP